MEMDMTNTIHVDLDHYFAEDNVKLNYVKYQNKEISSINVLKSTIEIELHDNSYSSPVSIKNIDNNLYLFLKKIINQTMRPLLYLLCNFFKNKKYKKIHELYIISRNDIENYRDLINVSTKILGKNCELLVLIDWLPNILEKFILRKFNLKSFNKQLQNMSDLMINLSEEIIFLAHNLDLKVKSSYKSNGTIVFTEFDKKYLSEFVEFRKNQNRDIEIVIKSEFPLEFVTESPGFQEREPWSPKHFGQFINKNVKNAFLLNSHENISIDNIEEIIKYGLNLVSTSDLKDLKSLMRLDLPGLLMPFDPLSFDSLVQQKKLTDKCFRVRSNGTSFIYFHLCENNLCEPELVMNNCFYHFQGLQPRNTGTRNFQKNLGRKKICMVLPPYSRASGGIVALYKLHDCLKENGFEVFVLPYNPTGAFPFRKEMNILFQEKVNFDLKDAIWIYSDTVSSIPVDAYVQVQWLMNRPGYLPATSLGSFRIKPSYVYKYSNVISEEITNKLFISNFDFELFYPRSCNKRMGHTIYLGKKTSLDLGDINRYFQNDYQIINRGFPLRKDLPDFLSASTTLISLDSLSALNLEANLCGTPTVVVTNSKSQFKEQDISRFELPTCGIVYNLDELDKVPKLDLSFHEHFKSEALKLEQSSLAKFLSFLEKL
jgi:hypothetical protein